MVSPTVTWRIFDASRVLANIGLQKSNKTEYANEQKRRNDLMEAAAQNKLSLEFARARNAHGLVSFLEGLDAERSLLSSQDSLASSDLAVTTDLVALYKALGGGWKYLNANGGKMNLRP